MDRSLIMMYRTFFLYDGKLSQDQNVITIKIPQHLKMEESSFYIVYRIHITDEKLLVKNHE